MSTYDNKAFNGDTKGKAQVVSQYPPEGTDFTSSKTSTRHILLISTVVCVVTAAIVCAIVIPVMNSQACDCGDENQSCTTTTEPTEKSTTKKPELTTPVHHGALRDPTAQTSYGDVIGHQVDMGTGDPYDDVMSYLGIRYAKPPNRWEKPEEPDTFSEPYYADKLQPCCIQHTQLLHFTQPYWNETSEDCLFMNIYSPMDTDETYPVMIWYHGGAYQDGGNIQYPGHKLAQKGVVVVVINYRLNIFGFASTEDGVLPGNFGMWDQRQAMLYVQKTIHAFGGDPARVTISGQSAGAASTGLHLVSPTTEGLFHQALFESGNYVTFWAINSDIDQPGTYLPQVANDVGCPSDNTTEMVDCLKTIDAEILLNAKFDCPFCLGFVPVIDGPGGYMPQYPWDIALSGGVHNVSILTGVNTGECSLFLIGLEPWTIFENAGFNRTAYQEVLMFAVDYFYFIVTETDVTPEDFYNLFNWFYTPLPDIHNETLNKMALSTMCTDGAFVAPNMETVKTQSAMGASVYMYVNGIMPTPPFPPMPDWLLDSVPHEMEIPFVWGYPAVYFGTESLRLDSGNLTIPLVCWGPDDLLWEDWFETLWTNFIIYGDPTPEPVKHPNPDAPAVTWDPYNNTDLGYLYMTPEDAVNMDSYRLREGTLIADYIMYMARNDPYDDVSYIPMAPLTRTQWLDPAVAEALGVTIAPINRKKRSLPDSLAGHHPISADARDLSGPLVAIILQQFSQQIDKLNSTLIEKRNMTLNDAIDYILNNWSDIQDSKCYNAVVPYAKVAIERHGDVILAKLKELLAQKQMTLPPDFTFPPKPTPKKAG